MKRLPRLVEDCYDDEWRRDLVVCDCGWMGKAEQMRFGTTELANDYSCQNCDALLLIVPHPEPDHTEQAAAAGSPQAVEQLATVEFLLQRIRDDDGTGG